MDKSSKKVYLVYTRDGNDNWRVDGVYEKRHSARARASKIRAKGEGAFWLARTLRGNHNDYFAF